MKARNNQNKMVIKPAKKSISRSELNNIKNINKSSYDSLTRDESSISSDSESRSYSL